MVFTALSSLLQVRNILRQACTQLLRVLAPKERARMAMSLFHETDPGNRGHIVQVGFAVTYTFAPGFVCCEFECVCQMACAFENLTQSRNYAARLAGSKGRSPSMRHGGQLRTPLLDLCLGKLLHGCLHPGLLVLILQAPCLPAGDLIRIAFQG